jgi:hypothetical protein
MRGARAVAVDTEDVQFLAKLKGLDEEASGSESMRHAAAWTRRYPDLLDWYDDWCYFPCKDHAHDEVVQRWVDESEQIAWPKARLLKKKLRNRLSGARRWLEEQDEQLAAVYAFVTSRPEYVSLPQSAKHVYDALHAVARTGGRLGGPNVVQSHRMLLALMKDRGHEYKTIATITNARLRLTGAGFITAEPGKPWSESDGKTISTVYHLLPPWLTHRDRDFQDHGSAISELALSARAGLVHSPGGGKGLKGLGHGVPDERPEPLSAAELAMLDKLRTERCRERYTARDNAEAARKAKEAEEEAAREAAEIQAGLDAAYADPEVAAAVDRRMAEDVHALLAEDESGDKDGAPARRDWSVDELMASEDVKERDRQRREQPASDEQLARIWRPERPVAAGKAAFEAGLDGLGVSCESPLARAVRALRAERRRNGQGRPRELQAAAEGAGVRGLWAGRAGGRRRAAALI